MQAGIVSYGAYIPKYRIKSEEIARIWGVDKEGLPKALNIISKSVPALDEDTATISVEASRNALKRCSINPKEIGAIYVGSESHPYVVKPTSTIVAESIGASKELTAADYEFACKAGTAAIQTCLGLVKSEIIKYGLAIGSDTSQGAPGDPLEYSASAGGACFIIGKENVIAEINNTVSFTTDTPDFWRREAQKYPTHSGRFTGEPAYFKHIVSCAKLLMEKMKSSPKDYNYAVFHQPNGKFPQNVAKMLGFTPEQIKTGLLTPLIGNTYSGSSPLGLCAILDIAKPNDRIFMVSFGSGAGSDGFDITITDKILQLKRENAPSVEKLIANAKYLDYSFYAKHRGKLVFGE